MRTRPSEQRGTIWTLLSFACAIIFMLHVMAIPVFYGIYALTFGTDDDLFAPIPRWFAGTAALSFSVAVFPGLCALAIRPRKGG